jgi:hypothetical protein
MARLSRPRAPHRARSDSGRRCAFGDARVSARVFATKGFPMDFDVNLPDLQGRRSHGRTQQPDPNMDEVNLGFGGIRARYRKFPGRVLRLVDPFSIQLVHFASPLQYENWLLRRFEPSVLFLDHRREEWSVLHHGKLLKVHPHLHWGGPAMKGCLELVAHAGKEFAPRSLEALDIVARAHGCVPSVRTTDQIRAQPALLDFLDRTRQVLTLHMREAHNGALRQSVLAQLRNCRQTPRADLVKEFGAEADEAAAPAIDAVLFLLRQTAMVRFDLEGGCYGNHTIIEAA